MPVSGLPSSNTYGSFAVELEIIIKTEQNMSDRKRLYLMDGSQFAFRAYYAFIRNPLFNSKGMNTSAPYGMLNSILKIIEVEAPDALAVAFDISKSAERLAMFPEYKATRKKMPEDLYKSFPYIRAIVEAMRIPVLVKNGVEADDILGTVARRAESAGWDVVLVTGDKDLMQLVDEHVSILAPSKGALPTEWFTHDNAFKRFGIPPDKMIDYLALVGDSADNIPGVRGIGHKTAFNLLHDYGSFDNIYEHIEEIKENVAKKLVENREMAELSRKLVTIDTDVDFDFDWENAELTEPDFEKLIPIIEELGFTSLLDKLYEEWGEDRRAVPEREFEYRLVGGMTELEEVLKWLSAASRISLDTETTSRNPMEAELVGISFSIEEGEAFYVPLGHRRAGEIFADDDLNLPMQKVLDALKPIIEDEKLKKLGQNLKYDYIVLANAGIELRGIDGDTMLADYLLEPGAYEHGLDALSLKILGHRMQSYKELVGEGKKEVSIAEIEPKRVAHYSGEDAEVTLRLANILEPRLEEMQLKKLYDTLEIPLLTVLADMQIAGVRIDKEFLLKLSTKLKIELGEIEKTIYDQAGEEFNIGSPKQLSHILFDKLKLPVQKKTKTGFSTDADVLQILSVMHELPASIIRFREIAKLLSTYVDALPSMINARTGRVHPTFQQAVTSTGRLSCKNPNLQNIPVRGETGREIRRAFVPAEGNILLSADYSQIELRMMAHISGDENLIRAFKEGRDIHAATASRIFDVSPNSVNPSQRRMAKVINFGVIYGMTAWGVSGRLKMELSEAKKFVDAYFERYPGVKKYIDETPKRVEELGYVETILGRRRYFDMTKSGSQNQAFIKRAAVNTPIQGSAADLIKIAMIGIHKRLKDEKLKSKMILTVHDELVFDALVGETEHLTQMVKEIMESAMELAVPLVVDIGAGKDWLDAHE